MSNNVSGNLKSISEDFNDMKNNLPQNAIKDIITKQNEMIDVLKTYSSLSSTYQNNNNYTIDKKNLMYRKTDITYEQEDIDIHTDVIFVGFPASAVESIRLKWFEPLLHTDNVMASISKNKYIVALPGQLFCDLDC